MHTTENIALGFYQNIKTAQNVLKKLDKKGFDKAALIHREHYGKIVISSVEKSYWPFIGALLIPLLYFLLSYFYPFYLTRFLPIFLIAALSLAIVPLVYYYKRRISSEVLNKFSRLVISDETLVIVQCNSDKVSEALSLLRQVESGHPTSFLLRAYDKESEKEANEIVKEPLTFQQMQEAATATAKKLKEVSYDVSNGPSLLKKLKKCEHSLTRIQKVVHEANFVEQTVTLSAEWLLDNNYVIQGNIEEVFRNLPKDLYNELPKMTSGLDKGIPRVYLIAKEMVKDFANLLNRDNIVGYLESYQQIDPLTMGELWVLPLMLRLRLIECLNYLSMDIERRLKEGEHASLWGNRLLNISKREPERLDDLLKLLKSEEQDPSAHFSEELIDHLYDEDKIIPLVQGWIEEKRDIKINDLIKGEQLEKSVEQVALSNAIISLIALSQLSWRDIFEKVSIIDNILGKDPLGIYSKMDFSSRDRYRHALEVLARGAKKTEGEVASLVLQKAEHGKDEVTSHVGYYLIDRGRLDFEKEIHYKPNFINFLRKKLILSPTLAYLGSAFVLTLIIESFVWYVTAHRHTDYTFPIILALLIFIPASEISLQIIGLLVTKLLQPLILPKLSYKDEIPAHLKTLIVIPSLMSSSQEIEDNLNSLEIHYLANPQKPLIYAIYYDFVDASEENKPEDEVFLAQATAGIQNLNEKYETDRFLLFYRKRIWNENENAWIGRERKRGKLEALNRYIMHLNCPETLLKIGNKEQLKDIHYVITLDADTQLPKDSAKQLIETISHPLNQARVSKDRSIERGYAIVQPRVATDMLHSKGTLFSIIFSDSQSLNPYTQAVSDVYQDLMSEGNYHGKGIYDVKAFHEVIGDSFPENHLLSHDLLEGIHLRVGFASDIVLSDMFPQDYYSWTKRQHRWMRGDWQIVDWVFSRVPIFNVKTSNNLSIINRWKILDNLRRALLPVANLSVLLLAFFASHISYIWAAFIVLVYFIPTCCQFIISSFTGLRSFVVSLPDIKNHSLRSIINIALMPQQAFLSLDVLGRVFYRKLISHKKLLEWETFKATSSSKAHNQFIIELTSISFFAAAVLCLVYFYNVSAFFVALPFCVLWLLAPFIVALLDKPIVRNPEAEISNEEKKFVRSLARKTWRYFDDFVGPQTNWLPPDNYQAALTIEVAQRTSPTNIGLWMLAVTTAYDFKYINLDDTLDRLLNTFRSFKKLEMYEGHFLNWYDIQTLKPLYPRYVSTVDSGNLLASFWTLEQNVLQICEESLLPLSIFSGLIDTLESAIQLEDLASQKESLNRIKNKLIGYQHKNHLTLIEAIENIIQEFNKSFSSEDLSNHYWLRQFEEQLNGWKSIFDRYFSWLKALKEIPEDQLKTLSKEAINWREESYRVPITLVNLASGDLPKPLKSLLAAVETSKLEKTQFKSFYEGIQTARWLAGEKIGVSSEIIQDINELSSGLNMRFLYNTERKLFSIGYHVDNCSLDNSYYDLLASEARIASFVAIAKDDVPLDHWWALGRPYGYLYGRHVLMSWGGTMFEYLMPLLFQNYYPNTLIGDGCKDAVACQIIYGEKRGIPWGISEAAYSAIDTHKIYQYKSFGVPGLGFKRGLEEDLVVSPYSTALALGINPKAAIKNMMKMKSNLLDGYGFYESIDFARQHAPHGERGVIVYAFMAHHQGMSLLAINNLLNDNIIRKRFHSNLRVVGMESLLSEKAPSFPLVAKGSRKEIPLSRITPFPVDPIMGVIDTAYSATPKVNILSNSFYSNMLTNSGAGYSRWKDLDVTRWRSDTTADNYGSFCFIKDLHTGDFWSTTHQPTCGRSKKYFVSFKADRTEIRKTDYQIEANTEIVISPEDDVEVRLVTIANLSKQVRSLELTSYMELALAPHATDAAHPAFNKLFIETESLIEDNTLLAFRRLRAPDDRPVFAAHVIAASEPSQIPVQFETDRYKFIGRGRSLRFPEAMEKNLSNSEGFVLDPIFSLRYQIKLNPGQRIQVSFVTLISDSREKTLNLAAKYKDLAAHHRAIEMAWAHAQLELRHLRVHQEEVQLFQKLASRLLYPQAQLRPSAEKLIKNHKGQSALWAYGISGDLPIIAINIADVHELDLLRQVLVAHIFLKMRNLKTDVVILNDEATGYEHPLFEEIQRMLNGFSNQTEIGKSGGVYLLSSDQIPEEDLRLILSVARVNLIAARGSLRQQLVSPMEDITLPKRLIPDNRAKDYPSNPLPFVELKYYNGVGGFSSDGREYMIYLGSHTQTPLPWSNVIANSQFGTLVTESGPGTTWFGNSQTNRVTPWSNDPVMNPVSDALYIRDDELGIFWSPTPLPIRELDPYRIRHGQGYSKFEHNSHGIEQELTLFVPINEYEELPVRIQKLKLKNSTNKKRKLSIYSFAELLMGFDKEQTQMHVATSWDAESQSMFAYNRYNPDYGDYLSFFSCTPLADSYTGNRNEFLGRNGHLSSPASLKRKKLSSHVGAAIDPCSALHVEIELAPSEEKELIFILGYAKNESIARDLIAICKVSDWVNNALQETINWWDKHLETIQVDTPDPGINFAFNRWLLYQNLSCRFWGRTAFYQSSGAYGFRDQLQDAMGLLYAYPKLAREQILRAASRQFEEGDVQHWWHPPKNGGVRTRISDDLLWLPYVTAQYIRVTKDASILDEEVFFIKGDPLREDQHETYFVPEVSTEKATILEHCRRALQKGLTEGPHGLPLIGGGDWNDGMNRVGIEGKGESVWLAWFLIHVMNDFADILDLSGQADSGDGYRNQAKRLAQVIEEKAWDGEWYRRAYYDDGTPIGSHTNIDARIDSLAQSWSIISKAGNKERSDKAMESLEKHLIKLDEKMVLLLTPPFDKGVEYPGYIKGYPPGVRENGGQYTHGSLWVPLAFAMQGNEDMALKLIRLMHPVSHTSNPEDMQHFKGEPYVLAADIYDLPGQVGRVGWTWYTGSGAWMYRVLLENIFGFTLRGNVLSFQPVIPKDWPQVSLKYRYQETLYNIVIERSSENNLELDGQILPEKKVELVNDKKMHEIKIKIN